MRLSCDEVEPMIAFLLDNELDAAQSLDVNAHLETCEACRGVLEDADRLRSVLRRAAASVAAPTALRNRLQLSMRRAQQRQTPMARAWPFAVAFAILVAFLWRG